MIKKIRFLLLFILFPIIIKGQYYGGNIEYREYQASPDSFIAKANVYTPDTLSPPDSLNFKINGSIKFVPKKDSFILCEGISNYVYTRKFNALNESYSAVIYDSSLVNNAINSPGIDSGHSFQSVIGNNTSNNLFFPNLSLRLLAKPTKIVEAGDSLRYIPTYDNRGSSLLDFSFSSIGIGNDFFIPDSMKLNNKTGEIKWEAPDTTGRYEIYLRVQQWLNGENNILKGTMYPSFSVIVRDSLNFSPEFFEISGFSKNKNGFNERHITPGDNLNLVFKFQDEMADSVALEAIGEPFSQNPSPFFFTSSADSNTINASFSWTPDSSHVRPHPYILTFIGKSYPSCTWHYKTVMIYVEDPATSVEEESENDEGAFSVHPNPVLDELILDSSVDLSQSQARVVDAQGKVVQEIQLRQGKDRINVQGLEKGIYFLVVQGEKGRWQERFVKR